MYTVPLPLNRLSRLVAMLPTLVAVMQPALEAVVDLMPLGGLEKLMVPEVASKLVGTL